MNRSWHVNQQRSGTAWILYGSALAVSMFAASINATAGGGSPTASIIGKQVPDFVIPDATGKSVALHDFREKSAVIVYFLGTDCPIANLYVKDLGALLTRYAGQGVQVIGIHSNAGLTPARAAEHAKEFKIAFPVLIDAGQRVADSFNAKRTAEVFVLDRQRTVRYHGAIDGRYGYTFKRGQPQRADLEEAVKELLAGKTVSVAETTPRGCLITRDERPKSQTTVTYAKEISRILQNRCEECHRAGEVAPFALQTFDEAAEHSAMMKEVVVQRRMPPWHADPRFGEFSNNRRMTQEEVDQLVAWIDAGSPLGDKRDLPPAREYAEGWQIGQPDFVFELPKEVKVPATGTVPYKYYSVKTNFKKDIWIQAAEARPGNRAVVHHIIVFCRDPKDWDPDGGLGDMHVCGTAPGDPPLILPPGVARKIPAGAEFMFQMHYTPNGKEATDRSKVGLVLFKGDLPEHSAKTMPVMNQRIRIPAGDPNYKIESKYKFPQDAMVYQLMPHMHVRGKDFLFELTRPNGKPETLLFVPQYDFNWQNTYRLKQPLLVPKGSTMHCVAHFDNSKDNPANPDPTKIVRWGDQTWEEMMIGWFTFAWTDPVKPAAETKQSGRTGKPRRERNPAAGDKTSQTPERPTKRTSRS